MEIELALRRELAVIERRATFRLIKGEDDLDPAREKR